jgi:hypothetical protein
VPRSTLAEKASLSGGHIMVVKIVPNDKGNPPGKLADAELHFTDGALDGLKLIGFAVWERRSGSGRNVTFPARQYSVNGERRSFALLRPIGDTSAQERVRDLVLQASPNTKKRRPHKPVRRSNGGPSGAEVIVAGSFSLVFGGTPCRQRYRISG